MQLTEILLETLLEARETIKRHKHRKQGPISGFVKEAIKNSIEHRWLLNIYYEGDKENAPGRRWIEPYVWGNHIKSQNDVLRAWQYKGKTTSIQPGWKMFRLDRISSTAPLTTQTFDRPRPLYNPHGDKHMSGIKIQVQFPNGPRSHTNVILPKKTPPQGTGAKPVKTAKPTTNIGTKPEKGISTVQRFRNRTKRGNENI